MRLLPEERLALLLGATYLLLDASWWWLYTQVWIGVVILSLLFWILAISFAIGRGIDAWKEPELPRRHRARRIIAMPLTLLAVGSLVWTLAPGARLAAAVSLKLRGEEMRRAQTLVGPGRAAAIPYVECIPDGGIALVRYAGGDPALLPQSEQLRLTYERIQDCKPIGASDWMCWFD